MQVVWQGKTVSRKKKSHTKSVSVYLPSFAPPSPFNQPTRLTRIGRPWQKCITPSLLDTSYLAPVCSKVYVLAEYVCFVPVVKNSILSLCSPMLMRMGSVGVGEALLRLLAAKGSFAANQRELQKPILTSSSKDAEEFLFWLKCRVAFSRMNTTQHNLTLTPWMISQVGLVWKSAGEKMRRRGGITAWWK